jgi:hypothetical protein
MLFASIERKDDRVVPRTIFHQNFNGLEIILAEIESIIILSGLPDGILSYQKSLFGYIFEGLGMENAGTIYDHCGHLVPIVSPFWYIVPIKIWQPCIFRPASRFVQTA